MQPIPAEFPAYFWLHSGIYSAFIPHETFHPAALTPASGTSGSGLQTGVWECWRRLIVATAPPTSEHAGQLPPRVFHLSPGQVSPVRDREDAFCCLSKQSNIFHKISQFAALTLLERFLSEIPRRPLGSAEQQPQKPYGNYTLSATVQIKRLATLNLLITSTYTPPPSEHPNL